jgi:glutamate racemase
MQYPVIGFFDSGVGGLTVWKAVRRLMPHADLIYLGDQAWCPYGTRPVQDILQRAGLITEFLLASSCKIIVVACNTATAAAIHWLRQTFPVPFVGMEPAVKPAASFSKTGHIGVLATEGTFRGNLFQDTVRKYAGHVQVHLQIGHGLVELVENGVVQPAQALDLIGTYLLPMQNKGVDQLVLGCTHYPFLLPYIEQLAGHTMQVIDPAPAVAQQVQRLAGTSGLVQVTGKQIFYTTGDNMAFRQFLLAQKIGTPHDLVEKVPL